MEFEWNENKLLLNIYENGLFYVKTIIVYC